MALSMSCSFSADPADEMAVRQRIFNSTSPFSGPPKAELKGSYPSSSAPDQETDEEEEEGKDSKMGYPHLYSTPLLNKLITHGTAEQVGEMPLKTSTFIAQAECKYDIWFISCNISNKCTWKEFNMNVVHSTGETQDSQEFSPSCSERSFVPSPNCFISRYDCCIMSLLTFSTSYLFTDVIFHCLMACLELTLSHFCKKSFIRAQQCGVSNARLRPGAKPLIRTAHSQEEEQEEAEAQGKEKSREEGEAAKQTSHAFWIPWTGEWKFSVPDPGEHFHCSSHLTSMHNACCWVIFKDKLKHSSV